jgi:hypothetical protein
MSALDKAIKAAGSARKLSLALGVTSMSVSHWKNRDHGSFRLTTFFQFSK